MNGKEKMLFVMSFLCWFIDVTNDNENKVRKAITSRKILSLILYEMLDILIFISPIALIWMFQFEPDGWFRYEKSSIWTYLMMSIGILGYILTSIIILFVMKMTIPNEKEKDKYKFLVYLIAYLIGMVMLGFNVLLMLIFVPAVVILWGLCIFLQSFCRKGEKTA